MDDYESLKKRQVTIQCEHVAPVVYNYFPRYVIWLGIAQVVGGAVLLIVGIATIFNGANGAMLGVYGFQLVVPAVLAGAFGIAAGRSRGICQIVTTMIFSILAAISSCAVVNVTSRLLYTLDRQAMGLYDQHEYYRVSSRSQDRAILIVTLVVALIEAITSIVLSSIACHFSCFCCKKCCCDFNTTTTEQVVIKSVQQTQTPEVAVALSYERESEQPTVRTTAADSQLNLPPAYNKQGE